MIYSQEEHKEKLIATPASSIQPQTGASFDNSPELTGSIKQDTDVSTIDFLSRKLEQAGIRSALDLRRSFKLPLTRSFPTSILKMPSSNDQLGTSVSNLKHSYSFRHTDRLSIKNKNSLSARTMTSPKVAALSSSRCSDLEKENEKLITISKSDFDFELENDVILPEFNISSYGNSNVNISSRSPISVNGSEISTSTSFKNNNNIISNTSSISNRSEKFQPCVSVTSTDGDNIQLMPPNRLSGGASSVEMQITRNRRHGSTKQSRQHRHQTKSNVDNFYHNNKSPTHSVGSGGGSEKHGYQSSRSHRRSDRNSQSDHKNEKQLRRRERYSITSSTSGSTSSCSGSCSSDDGDSQTTSSGEPNLPYPGFPEISMKYLTQDTKPRNWCLMLITNPYPF